IILPIWLLMVLDSKQFTRNEIARHFILLVLIISIVFLPWQIYILLIFPTEAHLEYGYNFKHISDVLGDHSGQWWYYINQMRINYGELIYLPLIWFLGLFYRSRYSLKNGVLLIWITVPILFFSFAATKMEAYILFASPALFIITALFIEYLMEAYERKKSMLVLTIVIIILVFIPLRYCIERIKPFAIAERNPPWAKELRNMEAITGEQQGIIFNVPRPVELMFYTDFTAYAVLPSIPIIEGLVTTGNYVFINEGDNIPAVYYQMKGIKWIHLTQ
ncbi:MAG TPA: hypothetical protein PLD84_13105, partial [Chitinophagales bacterium]|nr:hypothetical protein [Chitinophagales bacterium]